MFNISKFQLPKTLLLGTMFVLATFSIAFAGNWDKNWPDAPDQGHHSWSNGGNSILWYTTNKWTSDPRPDYDARFELELYDPENTNFCDRLAPTSLTEYGGDWIHSWSASNECGNAAKEAAIVRTNPYNIHLNSSYTALLGISKLQQLGYGGEVNTSYTCYFCPSDDWLGKLTYDSSYNKVSSHP